MGILRTGLTWLGNRYFHAALSFSNNSLIIAFSSSLQRPFREQRGWGGAVGWEETPGYDEGTGRLDRGFFSEPPFSPSGLLRLQVLGLEGRQLC